MFVLPAGMVKPEFVEPPSPMEAYRNDIPFDLSPDEQPYATWIAHDIERSWGYERMPPDIGCVIVPDVSTNARALGEATLFDCLFSDDHPWVKSPPPECPPDPSHPPIQPLPHQPPKLKIPDERTYAPLHFWHPPKQKACVPNKNEVSRQALPTTMM